MKEWLYYIAFGLLLFAKGVGLYDGTTAFKLFLLPALACLALKIFLTSYQKKEIVIVGVLLGVGAMTYLLSGEKGLLLYILLIVGMKSVPVKRIFAVGLVSWSAAFFGITISSLFHLYDTPYKVHAKLGLGYIFRWGMGYVHPNILHVSFLILLFFIVYFVRERFNFKTFLLMMAANCYMFMYSVSYAGFGMVCIYLVFQLYWAKRGKLGIVEKSFAYLVFPVCAVLSLIGPLVLEGRLYDLIDKVLNNRLHLSENFLKVENLSAFGVRIADLISGTVTMDNAYVFSFITYGVFSFAGIFFLYQLLIKKLIEKNMGTELVMTITILGYGLVEPFLFNTSLKNLSVIFVGACLWQELEKETSKDRLWLCIEERCRRFKAVLAKKMENKRKVIWAGLLAGVIISIAYGLLVKMPESYMVQRVHCETIGKDLKTFPAEYLTEHPEVRAVDYVNDTTYMEIYSGNMVIVEWVRSCMSAFVLGTVVVWILISGYYILKRE